MKPSQPFRVVAALLVAASVQGAEKDLAKLLKDLKHKNDDKRIEASLALVNMREPSAVPALTEALADREPIVRYNAAGALWNLREAARPAIPALQVALKDQDGGVRFQAAGALRALGQPPGEWLEVLRQALKDNDPDVRKRAEVLYDDVQKTDLVRAAQAGQKETVAGLLAGGIESGGTDKAGRTALHRAAESGDLPMVTLLLDKSAAVAVDAKDQKGFTPLHLAAANG